MTSTHLLPSRIDRVQVYRRGATVTRVAELTVEGALPSEVEVTDVPLTLIDPTARVRVVAVEPADAEVVAAGVRVGLWVRPGDPPPKAPEQVELEAVRLQLRIVREQLVVLDDGSLLFPSMDDEGNDGGALFGQTKDGKEITLPVI